MPALASNGRFAPGSSFEDLRATMSGQPLHEAAPARPGDGPAALGFALALARGWIGPAGLIFVGAQTWGAEEGTLSPRGLLAFGIDPGAVLAVHVRTGKEALWAAEQALDVSGVTLVCALADREVDLTASRRLLLKAEKNEARALLVRALRSGEGAMQSAAFTRWRVSPRVSVAPGRLLGAPAWRATLARRRGGAAGAMFDLEWNGDVLRSRTALAGDLAEAPADGSAAPARVA
jgi:protein ImuA